MPVKRSTSEPPENVEINQKTGLRGGFPIKISGHALGSQDSLAGSISDRGVFGQRIGIRRNSFGFPKEVLGERRRSLRGSTPVRDADDVSNVIEDKPSFMTPFGSSEQGWRRRSLGGVMNKGSLSGIKNSDSKIKKENLPSGVQLQSCSDLNNDSRFNGANFRESKNYSNINVELKQSMMKNTSNISVQNYSGLKVNRNSQESGNFSGHSLPDEDASFQNDLEHEIKNMSEKLTAFKIDTELAQFDTDLQKIEDNLQELNLEKQAIDKSNSLDDVITKMKNSLKAIKDGVNQNTLIDLNREITPLDLPPLREMTPLDLPALSPLPPMLMRRKRMIHKEQLPSKTQAVNIINNHQTENGEKISVDKCMPGLIINNPLEQQSVWNIVNRDTDPHSDGQGQSDNEEVESRNTNVSSLSSCSITVQLAKHSTVVSEVGEIESDKCIRSEEVANDSNIENKDVETIKELMNKKTEHVNLIGNEVNDSFNTKANTNIESIEILNKIDQSENDEGTNLNTKDDTSKLSEKEDEAHEDNHRLNSSESTYLFISDDSSVCSTPTVWEQRKEGSGYESDSTVYPETDCEDVYEPFKVNIGEICEISDIESEQEECQETTQKIKLIDTVIPSSEIILESSTKHQISDEKKKQEQPKPLTERGRRHSGRRKSMSSDKNLAKTRYCWRCHAAGHENWQCREDVQPGEWCPRCLETSHWEDACWVEAAHVLCPVCSVPGHLPCVHQATDFRQRKLIIDTFGWLSFKDWFQDLTFRSWWNCSGYTGVPLYKIMMRNNSQDLDLGFGEQ